MKRKFEYKIESRPGLYQCDMSSGLYSDKQKRVELISANSPEEAWYFLKQYMSATYTADDNRFLFLYGYEDDIVERFRISEPEYPWESDKDIEEKSDDYGVWRVRISTAKVIITLKS